MAHVSLADWVCSLAEDFASAHTPSDDMKDMDEDCFIQRRWQGRKSTYVRVALTTSDLYAFCPFAARSFSASAREACVARHCYCRFDHQLQNIGILLQPGTFLFRYRHRACDRRAGAVFLVHALTLLWRNGLQRIMLSDIAVM